MFWRIEIKAHNVSHLLGKQRVIAQLKSAQQVWLQAMLLPQSSHRSRANASCSGHTARAPVRGIRRCLVGSQAHDLLYSLGGDLRLAPRTRRIFLDVGESTCYKPATPTGHLLPRDAELFSNR